MRNKIRIAYLSLLLLAAPWGFAPPCFASVLFGTDDTFEMIQNSLLDWVNCTMHMEVTNVGYYGDKIGGGSAVLTCRNYFHRIFRVQILSDDSLAGDSTLTLHLTGNLRDLTGLEFESPLPIALRSHWDDKKRVLTFSSIRSEVPIIKRVLETQRPDKNNFADYGNLFHNSIWVFTQAQ